MRKVNSNAPIGSPRTRRPEGPLPTSHRNELFSLNGRIIKTTSNGVAFTQEHGYAKPDERSSTNKDFGTALPGFILSETLPCLTRGDLTGAITSLCSFILKFFADSKKSMEGNYMYHSPNPSDFFQSGHFSHSSTAVRTQKT